MAHRQAGLRSPSLATTHSSGTAGVQYWHIIETRAPGALGVKMSDDPFASSPWPFPVTAFRAVVMSIYDGDTCTALVEMADFMFVMKDIRFLGVDCYELRKGKKAWRAKGASAQSFTAQRIPPGTQIIVRTPQSEASDTEKYGRLLGRVFYWGADGREHDLAAELVAAGFQKPAAPSPVKPAKRAPTRRPRR